MTKEGEQRQGIKYRVPRPTEDRALGHIGKRSYDERPAKQEPNLVDEPVNIGWLETAIRRSINKLNFRLSEDNKETIVCADTLTKKEREKIMRSLKTLPWLQVTFTDYNGQTEITLESKKEQF